MIRKTDPISSKDFSKGLVTRADILSSSPDQSPNCMDIKWYFDGAVGKRFGASTTNSIALSQTGNFTSWIIDQNASLSTNLQYFWKFNEVADPRLDSSGTNNLLSFNSVSVTNGLINSAALVNSGGSMISSNNALFDITTSNVSISTWLYADTIGAFNPGLVELGSQNNASLQLVLIGASKEIWFRALSNNTVVTTTTLTGLSIGSWNNVICWRSNGAHIGISLNNASINSASFTGAVGGGTLTTNSDKRVSFGTNLGTPMRYDETGIWNKVLTSSERSDLYGGGTGNTFTTGITTLDSWTSFDFGASAIRWYIVAQGTGILASSNGGTTFVNVATSRTQTWQYFERSKNVLICTSDAYDPPLYWAGSAGTFAATLAPNSAPAVRFSINYQGFLILLNSQLRKRGFFYADENLQLTDPWTNGFDIPSSADDEITAAFVLYRWLYISTKYSLYRLIFSGGNPDWQYLKVKDWGYVPRTVKIATIKGQQVAVGEDFTRRIRVFDGFDDLFVSDNVENDNSMCDFAMRKISLSGSGLQMCHAVYDILEQEYRLNVAIGAGSTATTHAILLNGRTTALYPYSNQPYNTSCMAESGGVLRLMAVDRSGFVHILNSGNMDVAKPINENYDLPFLFKGAPETVHKSNQINFFFAKDSCGTVYYQDRYDFSNVFSEMRPLTNVRGDSELKSSDSATQLVRTLNIAGIQNIYQGRMTSSAGTANPWKMTHFDYLQEERGYGRA